MAALNETEAKIVAAALVEAAARKVQTAAALRSTGRVFNDGQAILDAVIAEEEGREFARLAQIILS